MTTLFQHLEQRPQRDRRGRFTKGNQISKRGGQARAKALTPQQRQAISRKGWAALVRKHFDGDEVAAKAWFGQLGAWNYDQQAGAGNGYIFSVFLHPGQPSEFRARRYQLHLFLSFTLDDVPELEF